VAAELQGQLLARDRELHSREGAITAWEDRLVAFAHVLGEVHTEHDASHVHAVATKQDFLYQARVSSTRSKQLTNLGRTFEGC
jgi:hypothetical protein